MTVTFFIFKVMVPPTPGSSTMLYGVPSARPSKKGRAGASATATSKRGSSPLAARTPPLHSKAITRRTLAYIIGTPLGCPHRFGRGLFESGCVVGKVQLMRLIGAAIADAVLEHRIDRVGADHRTRAHQAAVEYGRAFAIEVEHRGEHRRRLGLRGDAVLSERRARRIAQLVGTGRPRKAERAEHQGQSFHKFIQSRDKLSAPITMRTRF